MTDKTAGPDGSGLSEGLGPLVEAAEKYAANYNDDDRQDIRCDVLNAWHAGATFGLAAERTRAAAIARRWGETHADGVTVNARNAASKIARGIEGPNVELSGHQRPAQEQR